MGRHRDRVGRGHHVFLLYFMSCGLVQSSKWSYLGRVAHSFGLSWFAFVVANNFPRSLPQSLLCQLGASSSSSTALYTSSSSSSDNNTLFVPFLSFDFLDLSLLSPSPVFCFFLVADGDALTYKMPLSSAPLRLRQNRRSISSSCFRDDWLADCRPSSLFVCWRGQKWGVGTLRRWSKRG